MCIVMEGVSAGLNADSWNLAEVLDVAEQKESDLEVSIWYWNTSSRNVDLSKRKFKPVYVDPSDNMEVFTHRPKKSYAPLDSTVLKADLIVQAFDLADGYLPVAVVSIINSTVRTTPVHSAAGPNPKRKRSPSQVSLQQLVEPSQQSPVKNRRSSRLANVQVLR